MDLNPDMEAREVTFTAASGEPYRRFDEELETFYYERLVLTEDAVDLSRLNGGASVLRGHDSDHVLGTVVKAWIEDGKLAVRARFRKADPESDEVFRDIVDGTLKNVSIGYQVEAWQRSVENGIEFRDITRWLVFEVSVAVGVPADPTVGFYRSMDYKNKGETMKEETPAPEADPQEELKDETPAEQPPAEKSEEEPSADQVEKEEEEVEAEAAPETEEVVPARECDKPEQRSATSHREAPTEKIRTLNNFRKERSMGKTYSYVRAIQSLLNPKAAKADYEREVSDRMMAPLGIAGRDNSIMLAFQRDGEFINASDNGSGLVGTDHRGDLFVEMLRTRMGVKNATIISGLVGNADIPVQTGASTVGIGALNSESGLTHPVVDSVVLSPKKFSAAVTVGEDLITQGNPDAIAFVINDLQAQLARKLDLAILNGNVSPAIAGVDGTTGVQTVTIADLASITWADVLAMYGKIADYEIADGDLAWVTKGSTKATLMGVSKDVGSGRFLCEDGKMNGYDVDVCGALAGDALYLGAWKNVIIGQWGGLQVRVDDVTGIREGSVTIVAKLIADIAITNPNAFVKRVGAGS